MAVKGSKTYLEYGNSSGGASSAYTSLAKVLDIKPPKIEADDIDVSEMLSPNQFKEYSAGWANGGEIEATIQFEKSQNAAVYGLFRVDKDYRIVFPDATYPNGSQWLCSGYLRGFSNEIEREKIVTADITIKVSGQPVFTPAASGM